MQPRKTTWAALFLAVLLCAALGAPARGEEAGTDFTLESAAGERVSLRQAAGGKPVLLVFWATWCPHCNEAVPEINRIQSRLSDRLQVLAIDYMESRKKVTAFMKAKGISYPVLLDSNGDVARQYRVVGIPTYVVLDKGGKVVYADNALPASLEKFL